MTENSSNGNPFYFDVERLRMQREWDIFVRRNKRKYLEQFEEQDEILKQIIDGKYKAVKKPEESTENDKYNLIKLDNGLWIDGTRVNHLTDCKIDSSVDNFTEVTLKFIAKVDGLDNIDINRHFYEKA